MPSHPATPTIAVVGAGFTGTLLAVHLLKSAREPLAVSLIDSRGEFGRGTAYATGNPSHLLNVRAANMSAFPDDPSHFLMWLWRRDDPEPHAPAPPSGDAFVPRGLYGAYLQATLQEAVQAAGPRTVLRKHVGQIVDLEAVAARWRLRLADGSALEADTVVLCVGHFAPRLPCEESDPGLAPPAYIADPWDGHAIERVARGGRVVIVGTGLTMVDVVLSLLDQGHHGPILAISRRGLLPQRHAEAPVYDDFIGSRRYLPRTTLGALRVLRAEVRAANAEGYNWRSVLDAVRPHTQRIWAGLPIDERRRFLRHARPYWEIHRHRMAPKVAGRLWDARSRGQLQVLAGRLQSLTGNGDRVLITYRPRGGGEVRSIDAATMINCSGPECDFAHVSHPLIAALLDRRLARADPLRLGIETTFDNQVVAASGQPVRGLLAIGPIARGAFWELTAVPELRNVCAIVGQRLTLSLASSTAA